MILRSTNWWPALAGVLLLAGCYYPVREKIDAGVCDIARQPFDLQHLDAADHQPVMPPTENDAITQTAHTAEEDSGIQTPAGRRGDPSQKPFNPFKDLEKAPNTLQVPPDLLPGGPPKELELGPATPENAARRQALLRREFQPLPPPGPDFEGVPGPFGHPLTLTELQRIGMSSSPVIKQAVAAVESARGTAFQAGLLPNPVLGFEVDTFGTTGGAGYAGGYMQQLIKTAGKLRLSRAVAAMDLRNAEVALRRAQMDLATRIRTYYFQLLVARENQRINRILVAFADAVYEFEAGQLRGKAEEVAPTAPYEPMYLRALANTARTNLVVARNNYVVAWKQLAAALGLPGMPMTQLAGDVSTMRVPVFDFPRVWLHVGQNHTDVVTAENNLQQSRFSLMLAQVQPYPDVDVRFLIQKDYTGPPNAIAPSVAVSVPVPVWNRNQGGIAAAQANVVQMGEEPLRVRNDLYARLFDASQRYQAARQNLHIFRDQILPDLVRVYNAIYKRYQFEKVTPPAGPGDRTLPISKPEISDVIVAQQLLTTNIANYILNLSGTWQAVVDVTDLIQTNDLFRMGGQPLPTEEPAGLPDLQQIKPLLPTHPCSPLPHPRLRGGDATWPQAIPTTNNPHMPAAEHQSRKGAAPKTAVAAAASPSPQPVPLPDIDESERRPVSSEPPRTDPPAKPAPVERQAPEPSTPPDP
jgi:cobalt-zinc-cadmium efflux system outer membrane protein